MGWDGWIRPGRWHPVVLRVRSEQAISGRAVLELDPGARVRYTRPVRIAAGGEAVLRFAAPLWDVRSSPVLALREGDRLVASVAVPLSARAAASSLVGVLDRDRRGLGLPPGRTVAFLDEEDLPEEPVAYTSLDLLVIRSLEERALNERQSRALRAWVARGGRVVLAGGFEPTGPLGRWLAAGDVGLGRVERSIPDLPVRRGSLTFPSASPPRPPFGPGAVGLLLAWTVLYLSLRLTGSGRWLGIPLGVAIATVGLVSFAGELRRRVILPDRRSVTVVAAGVAWTEGVATQISAYGGPVIYGLPADSSVALGGEFTDAEVHSSTDTTSVVVRQQPGQPLAVRWVHVERTALRAAVDPEGRQIEVAGGALGRSWLLWRGGVLAFDRLLQGSTPLGSGRPQPLDAQHPGLRAWREVDPASDDIMKDHPVVLAEAGDRWIVLVVERR